LERRRKTLAKLLQKHGNSVALVFDKTMLDALQMTPDTPVSVTISGGSLVITPCHVGVPQTELRDAINKLRPRYKRMLENLAK
jgi:antitoxin component of MazEF toxin-antitoxin module